MTVYIKAKVEMQLSEWKKETLHTGLYIYICVQVYPRKIAAHTKSHRGSSECDAAWEFSGKPLKNKQTNKTQIKSADSTAERNHTAQYRRK